MQAPRLNRDPYDAEPDDDPNAVWTLLRDNGPVDRNDRDHYRAPSRHEGVCGRPCDQEGMRCPSF